MSLHLSLILYRGLKPKIAENIFIPEGTLAELPQTHKAANSSAQYTLLIVKLTICFIEWKLISPVEGSLFMEKMEEVSFGANQGEFDFSLFTFQDSVD